MEVKDRKSHKLEKVTLLLSPLVFFISNLITIAQHKSRDFLSFHFEIQMPDIFRFGCFTSQSATVALHSIPKISFDDVGSPSFSIRYGVEERKRKARKKHSATGLSLVHC